MADRTSGGASADLRGILPVNKPSGITSHDVVVKVRRFLGIQKIGHTGTLDPLASGLLLLCVGAATRFAGYLTRQDKTYRARIILGASTATDDTEGTVVFHFEGDLQKLVTDERLNKAIEELSGRIDQVPPAFSSKKIGGVPAYKLARRGEKAELAAVPVHIGPVRVLNVDLPELEVEFSCSAGTYLRAFARDLGSKLGCGGHLGSLVRTACGCFLLEQASSLEELSAVGRKKIKDDYLLPVEDALSRMPAVYLDTSGQKKIYHGRAVDLAEEEVTLEEGLDISPGPYEVRLYVGKEIFVGIGMLEYLGINTGWLRPKRLMLEAFPPQ
ncbi:tRNA pseudouridine(55) synthase TruB [Gemmatimonadota bacterium]